MTILKEGERPEDPELESGQTAIWKTARDREDGPEWHLVKKVKANLADDWLNLLKKDAPDFDYKISDSVPI